MSSDSEIEGSKWKEGDDSTYPRTRVWEKGKETGWNKSGGGVFVVDDKRIFCAACFVETGSGIRPHAEAKKGPRAGKRTATCMSHEKELTTEGENAKKKLLKSIGLNSPLFERVSMADPIYLAAPIEISIFDRIKKKYKPSARD